MLKKIIACTVVSSMFLSILGSSTFAMPHFNPSITDFNSPISGERNTEQAVPGCKTCINYILRYEFVEQLVQVMNSLIYEANNNKEKNLQELKHYQKVRDLLGAVMTAGSEKIIEKVLQNVFDSLKEQSASNELALNVAQATIGTTIGIWSISALKTRAAATTAITAGAGTTATAAATAGTITTGAAAATPAVTAATAGAATTAATAGAATTAATAGAATTAATAAATTGTVATTAAATKMIAAMPYVGAIGGPLLAALSIGLIGYSYYISNENNKEQIKINNYTSVLGRLYSKLLNEDWKGNNVLILAFDHGKNSPGAYVEFYKVNGIDYGNVNFGPKFSAALNNLEMILQQNN